MRQRSSPRADEKKISKRESHRSCINIRGQGRMLKQLKEKRPSGQKSNISLMKLTDARSQEDQGKQSGP